MKKTIFYLLLIFIIFAAAGCENSPTHPDPIAEPDVPEVSRITVGRQWFYGRVNELADMDKKTFVQRTDWLADILDELAVDIEGK